MERIFGYRKMQRDSKIFMHIIMAIRIKNTNAKEKILFHLIKILHVSCDPR